MNGVCMCAVICFTSSFVATEATDTVSAQYIQIQALPLMVNYRENDLNMVCSISNPTQLKSVFYTQLQKNSITTFDTILSIFYGQTPPIQWKDSNLQTRAPATGNIDSPSTTELRLSIDKNSVQCPADFKTYMCKISGLDTASDTINKKSSPITLHFIVMYLYWYSLLSFCTIFQRQ